MVVEMMVIIVVLISRRQLYTRHKAALNVKFMLIGTKLRKGLIILVKN